MSKIDVLIIKPGDQKKVYGNLSSYSLTAYEPPLWASLLAGYLRGKGFNVDILDAEVEELSFEETAERIIQANPYLAAISVSGTNPSASTMNMSAAGKILTTLKENSPDIKAIIQGLHSSALPERTLNEEKTDFVCQGEGFFTLEKLVDRIKSGSNNYENIEGLWYRKDGKAVSNPPAPVYKNLDELPMPAWDLLPMNKYRAHNWHCFDDIHHRQPYGVLYTSLGCPYNCSFCCINAIFGKPGIRFRSPHKVVEEIDFLVRNYGIKNIKIIDELFAVNEKRVVEICDLIIERNYDLNMWAYARVNTVTPNMLYKMKKAGINWVAYGFESGSSKSLQGVNKGYDLAAVQNVVKTTYDAGLYICANFIFGLPEDDFDSMYETLRMAQDINAEWANFYAVMAYPGSRLYEEALLKGYELPDTWQGYSPYSYECLPLETKHLTPGEVLSFRDYAFDVYFNSPRYLDKIKRQFGMEAVHHIQEMSKHKLERKFTQFQ